MAAGPGNILLGNSKAFLVLVETLPILAAVLVIGFKIGCGADLTVTKFHFQHQDDEHPGSALSPRLVEMAHPRYDPTLRSHLSPDLEKQRFSGSNVSSPGLAPSLGIPVTPRQSKRITLPLMSVARLGFGVDKRISEQGSRMQKPAQSRNDLVENEALW